VSRFSGKTVVVTGAAGGLGFATAQRFKEEGAHVVGVDRSTRSESPFELLEADVSQPADWRRIAAHCLEHTGRVDVLVNNAAILIEGNIESATLDDFQRTLAVNVQSVFLGCQTFLPLIAQGGGGAIVNIASIASIMGIDSHAAYCASKGAVAALTKSIAVHCRKTRNRVRCNSVHPDGILTPMLFASLPPGVKPEFISTEQDPMNRFCPPEDVVAAIVFLASDEAKSIQGIEMRVDNGQSVMGRP
jgi:3(or 17)beta-hydroxysteroid dehydrogenase